MVQDDHLGMVRAPCIDVYKEIVATSWREKCAAKTRFWHGSVFHLRGSASADWWDHFLLFVGNIGAWFRLTYNRVHLKGDDSSTLLLIEFWKIGRLRTHRINNHLKQHGISRLPDREIVLMALMKLCPLLNHRAWVFLTGPWSKVVKQFYQYGS